jgi:hypothetical protein
MTSEMGEMFTAMRERSRARRANNRAKSAQMLRDAGVEFVEKNGGAHLIVAGCIDCWPGTGLWQDRNLKTRARGVRELLRHVRQHYMENSNG